MESCEDCGCILRNGICTNCNEELYIFDYQMSDDDELFDKELSKEFTDKVKEQREKLNKKNDWEKYKI